MAHGGSHWLTVAHKWLTVAHRGSPKPSGPWSQVGKARNEPAPAGSRQSRSDDGPLRGSGWVGWVTWQWAWWTSRWQSTRPRARSLDTTRHPSTPTHAPQPPILRVFPLRGWHSLFSQLLHPRHRQFHCPALRLIIVRLLFSRARAAAAQALNAFFCFILFSLPLLFCFSRIHPTASVRATSSSPPSSNTTLGRRQKKKKKGHKKKTKRNCARSVADDCT